MSRPCTGTLLPPRADGLWRCRVTVKHPDGKTTRPVYSLGTTDKPTALRRMAKLVGELAAGREPFIAQEVAGAPERVREYAVAWLEKREQQGIPSVVTERRHLVRHVLPAIGHMPLCDVRPPQIVAILKDVATKLAH